MELPGNITNSAPERRALRVNEFCATYGLSRSTAYKLMKQGKLRTVLIGGRRVVPVDAAEALLKEAAR
jgi:excisionase family DNA binding protein